MDIRVSFSEEMNKIRHELTLMAAKAEENIGKALAMFRSGSDELGKEIRENSKSVDALQIKIEDMVLVLIATQQPVARDVRELVTIFKLASNIERIDDFAMHLAKAAVKLSSRPLFRSFDRIEKMAETGQEMFKEAFSAYLAMDNDAARRAAKMDDIIDQEHKILTDEVLSLIKEKPKLVKPASRILKLSGYMERMGDHITTICEGVLFITDSKHEELNH